MSSRRMRVLFGAALLVLAALLAASFVRFQGPVDTAATAAAASSAGPSSGAVAPTGPGPSVRCTSEPGPLSSMLASDPCPSAIAAVIAAVADVRIPVERIVVEPGPFYCNVIWPGVGSPAVCFGYNVQPGQFMHAWASFAESDRVAAVMLGLDLPDDQNQPGATRPPWRTTLVAIEVPPAGWVMP